MGKKSSKEKERLLGNYEANKEQAQKQQSLFAAKLKAKVQVIIISYIIIVLH